MEVTKRSARMTTKGDKLALPCTVPYFEPTDVFIEIPHDSKEELNATNIFDLVELARHDRMAGRKATIDDERMSVDVGGFV
jgi:hypothetical protein